MLTKTKKSLVNKLNKNNNGQVIDVPLLYSSLERLNRYYKEESEPPHDKTNKMTVCPAKTQISLGMRPVWSESSLSAWRDIGSLATHWAHCEDSDQTGRMPRLIWVFAGRTVIFIGFITRRLISVALFISLVVSEGYEIHTVTGSLSALHHKHAIL